MPELRRSARNASRAENIKAENVKPTAVKAEEQPPSKKAKTHAAATEDKSPELNVGDKIPDITLLDENENEVSLTDAAKKTKFLVIFAYPKASTPGCTRQACGFQKNYTSLKDLGATVYGLSADSPKSQLNFVTKQGLKYPLLSDPSRKLISVLGAKKSPSGIKRSHWIFVDGVLKVKQIQISPEVSINSALETVQKLKTDGDSENKPSQNGENGTEKKEE